MNTITISPVIPDLKIGGMYPCSALVAPKAECGATPASLYLRTCGSAAHERRIWLCPTHALMAVCGGAMCRECAAVGGVVFVVLFRLSGPIRIPGGIHE